MTINFKSNQTLYKGKFVATVTLKSSWMEVQANHGFDYPLFLSNIIFHFILDGCGSQCVVLGLLDSGKLDVMSSS